MDVLLSLPIVSYFFSTSLTSWSTSLNLLFFYMTWTTLVLSHSPIRIEIVGTAALRIALWLVPSLFFLAFDTLLPSLAQSIKHDGAAALPPRDARTLASLAGLALLNLALETGVEAGVSLGLTMLFKSPVFRASTTLPLPWQMIKHLAFLLAAREVLAYSIHRYLLHGDSCRGTRSRWWSNPLPSLAQAGNSPNNNNNNNKTMLPRLHARHAHFRAAPPFALLAKADHPLPHLLHHLAPVYLPAALALRPWRQQLHLLTYLLFVALAQLEETLAMSGYSVVPGLVMGGIARRRALHYASGGGGSSGGKSGNYGAWGLLDWACGTSVGGDVVEDLRDEAEKHRVGDRVGEKVGEVRDGLGKQAGRSRRRKGKSSSGGGGGGES